MIVRPPKVCGKLPIGLMRNESLPIQFGKNDLPFAKTGELPEMFHSPEGEFQQKNSRSVVTSDDELLALERQARIDEDAALKTLTEGVPRKSLSNSADGQIKEVKGSCCSGGTCKTNLPARTATVSIKNKDESIPTANEEYVPTTSTAPNHAVVVSSNNEAPAESMDGFKNARKLPTRQTEIINNFSQRKIVDYLKTGLYKKVLIRFHHGLGDTVLFYASGGIEKLCEMFPDIEIAFHTALGQEEVFGVVDNDVTHYDIVFEPRMPLSEWDSEAWNKAEKCLHVEFGIPVEFGRSVWKLPQDYGNRLIGFHFHSTCMKNLTVREDSALKVWQYVQNKGFVALSTHMRHKNSHTILYRFESSNVIDEPARVSKLFGLLKACAGFAGTASGNFHSALAILPPEKIMFLRTDFDVKRITHLPVFQLDVRDPGKINFSVVDRWLENVARQD